MINRVVFLDIDGVLNSWQSSISNGMPMRLEDLNEKPFEPFALMFFRALLWFDVKIVISSTWRRFHSVEQFQSVFGPHVISMTTTDNLEKECHCRGDEIEHWLTKHPDPDMTWVIVDDDADMLPHQLRQFVRTDFSTGFLITHAIKVCDLLNISSKKILLEMYINSSVLKQGPLGIDSVARFINEPPPVTTTGDIFLT